MTLLFKHYRKLWFTSFVVIIAFAITPRLFAASDIAQSKTSTPGSDSTLIRIQEENSVLEKDITALREKLEAKEKAPKLQKPQLSNKKGFLAKIFGRSSKPPSKVTPVKPSSKPTARSEEKQPTPQKIEKPKQLEALATPMSETKEAPAETEKFLFPAVPKLETPGQMTGEMPRSGLLTLQECLEQSIRISLPKEIGSKRKSLNQWQLAKAIRDLFPEVTFKYDRTVGSITGGAYRGRSYSFELKQPLFHGFSLVNTVMQQKHNRTAAIAEIKMAVNNSAYEALTAYFELTRAELVYENHRELALEGEKRLKQSDEKKRQGLISEIEYLNVKSLHADMMAEMETFWGEREVAALQLKKALRLPPDEEIQIAPLYDYDSYKPKTLEAFSEKTNQEATQLKMADAKTLDDYLMLAYKNRPDLKMEQSKLLANRYAEKAAKGKWLPQSDMLMRMGETAQAFTNALPQGNKEFNPDFNLNIVTGWNIFGNTLKHTYDNAQTAPSLTAFQGADGTTQLTNTFTAQLLDGLQQYADVRQAQVQTLEQLQIYEDVERQTVQEIVEAFYKYRSAVVKLQSAAAGVNYQRRSVELSKLKLDKNEIQISEYLDDAVNEYAIRRDEFHNAMADYFSSKADLNHAVGIQDFIPIDETVYFKNV